MGWYWEVEVLEPADHESEALVNRTTAFIEETPERSLNLSTMGEHSETPNLLDLELPSLYNYKK